MIMNDTQLLMQDSVYRLIVSNPVAETCRDEYHYITRQCPYKNQPDLYDCCTSYKTFDVVPYQK